MSGLSSMPDGGSISEVISATWTPEIAEKWLKTQGPWCVGDLDEILSAIGNAITTGTESDCTTSASDVEELVADVAGGLVAAGAHVGSPVTWTLPNCLAAVVLCRACWRIGAVAAPVLHTLGPSDVAACRKSLPPSLVIDIDADQSDDPDAIRLALGVSRGSGILSGSVTVPGSSIAIALFTSGSTGAPKAVLHSHRALSWKATLMARVHGLGSDDVVLMPAPLAHVSGLLNGILLPGVTGMKSVLVRRFDPVRALAAIATHRVSFMAGPPTFFVAMGRIMTESGDGENDGHDVSSVRLISSGGASVTPTFVRETARIFRCRVKRTYGSTEAPTVATSTTADDMDSAAETDGRAVGAVELRLVAPDDPDRTSGTPVDGTSGELWVRGPELFAGYADRHQTDLVTTADGWYRTGDLATIEDGWLRIVGRLKDIIIRGGENISASEVEAILESHPMVRQAVAIGYPDEMMGERVCACVVLVTSDDVLGIDEIRAWFTDKQVARFKTPERVIVLASLPLLGTGKPDREALRARAAAGRPESPSR